MMNRALAASALTLLSSLSFPCNAGAQYSNSPPPDALSDRIAAAEQLARQVREIAGSRTLSSAKKEKRIANAVRVAVVAATAYKSDPRETLPLAIELSSAAAQAAPRFTEIIVNATAFTPAVARLDGAAGQIRTASFSAAKNLGQHRALRIASQTIRPPVAMMVPESDAPAPRLTPAPDSGSSPTGATASTAPTVAGHYPDPYPPASSTSPASSEVFLGHNYSLHATADASIRHDDNVYLTPDNEVTDQIVSLKPGIEAGFGQNSLINGSLLYQIEFVRYLKDSAADATLHDSQAEFGYRDELLALGLNAAYRQSYQNSRDLVAVGQQKIFQTNVLTFGASAESHLTAKTSARLDAVHSTIDYETSGFTGNRTLSLPVKVYYVATPKIDLSAGVAYREIKPSEGAGGGRDYYYNVGARGSFSEKLEGEFSVGYRTRDFNSDESDSLWGFDATFDYELTPKSSAALVLSRDFKTSALGESLATTGASLRVSTALTPLWQVGGGVSYQHVDYGSSLFNASFTPVTLRREDDYLEGNIFSSYTYSAWLSGSAGYTHRLNRSTVSGVEFTNNLISLLLRLRY